MIKKVNYRISLFVPTERYIHRMFDFYIIFLFTNGRRIKVIFVR